MPSKEQITSALKDSMRAGEKERVKTLRLITSAIKQIEVDERIEVDDERLLTILDKMVKQRRDSITQYESAGRDDLSAIEKAEIEIIQVFMPEPLSETEIDALIVEAISASGASSMKEMGKVMGFVRPKAQGRADMGVISQRIKEKLNG